MVWYISLAAAVASNNDIIGEKWDQIRFMVVVYIYTTTLRTLDIAYRLLASH